MLLHELPEELIELIAQLGGPFIYNKLLKTSKSIGLTPWVDRDRKLWQNRFGYKQFDDGLYEWKLNGKRHSQWGQPAFVCKHGTKFWYNHGKVHRDCGCAMECNHGGKWKFKNGKYQKTIKRCAVYGWVVCVCVRCVCECVLCWGR